MIILIDEGYKFGRLEVGKIAVVKGKVEGRVCRICLIMDLISVVIKRRAVKR